MFPFSGVPARVPAIGPVGGRADGRADGPVGGQAGGQAGGADPVGALCREVLASLPRSDQRRTGELYVRSLLTATGRHGPVPGQSPVPGAGLVTGAGPVTGEGPAAGYGPGAGYEPALAQRLHHFVNDSPWDWRPVRRALAARVDAGTGPVAWAVRSSTVGRSTFQCVGVDNFADYATGRTVRGQRAVGLWLVTDRGEFPVTWRLTLTARWLADPVLRARAAIPDDVVPAGPVRSALDCVREMADGAGVRTAPLILDCRRTDLRSVLRELTSLGVPYLVRVSGSELLAGPAVAPPRARQGPPRRLSTARQLAGAAAEPGPKVLRVPCRTAADPTGRPHVLLVVRDPRAGGGPAYWLTGMAGPATKALGRIAARHSAPARTADPVPDFGLHAYAGRSFAAWHRHTTLASLARAAALLFPHHARQRHTAA
ncbi:transposase [Streptomyces sp. NPDC047928]|uniref:IS701 family transposase n=1 Tax=unclassified Streptomyces TaxID=2593676 RepID=UPI003717785F